MPKIILKQKIALILFGVALSLVIIDIIFRAAGFIYLRAQENRNQRSLSKWGEYQILFLGESTTAEGGEDSYPRKVGRILREKIPGIKFSVINKGTPGVDTTYILSRLEDNLRSYKPNMVVAMIGINDQAADVAHGGRLFRGIGYIKRLRLYKLLEMFLAKVRERNILKEIYLSRARYHQEKNDYAMAERLFNKAINVKPEEYDAYIEFALYYVEREDYAKAEEFFDKAVHADPKEHVPYLEYGRYWMERQEFSKSEEMLKKALDLSD
ncbi:MAG: GDSL-type esterase/lipase family protein, partial [Candidatus Omnitrophota bacterium]